MTLRLGQDRLALADIARAARVSRPRPPSPPCRSRTCSIRGAACAGGEKAGGVRGGLLPKQSKIAAPFGGGQCTGGRSGRQPRQLSADMVRVSVGGEGVRGQPACRTVTRSQNSSRSKSRLGYVGAGTGYAEPMRFPLLHGMRNPCNESRKQSLKLHERRNPWPVILLRKLAISRRIAASW